MRSTVQRYVFVLLTPMLMLAYASARAQSPEAETDTLYLGNRVTLASGIPRQLTLNAHIQSFAWSPTGMQIAYFAHPGPNFSDTELAVVRSSGGRPHIYYSTHADPQTGDKDPTYGAICELVGWSPDGTHLAFIANAPDTQTRNFGRRLFDVDLLRGSTRFVSLPVWDDALPEAMRAFWAPIGNLLAVSSIAQTSDGPRLVTYDATTHKSRLMPTPGRYFDVDGWTSDGKIIITVDPYNTGTARTLLVDPVTASSSSISRAAIHAMAAPPDQYAPVRLNAGTAGMLTLQVGDNPEPVHDPAGTVHGQAVTLWMVVTPDKPVAPFTSARHAPKLGDVPPLLKIDDYRTFPSWNELAGNPTDDTTNHRAALARVSRLTPSKTQVAYLISGDLYVSDISVRTPSVQELISAGEKLTCPEEQQLAELDAKELGLAILQYVQDYDEHYPMADNFHDEVFPYIKSEEAFQVGDNEFHFSLEGQSSAAIDDPSTTEIGDFDLPCGRVVLYADGHAAVKKKDDVTGS